MNRLATTTALTLAWMAIAGVATAIGPASAACVEATIDALQERYESVSDFRADFVQTTRSVALAGSPGTGRASGSVVFAKPSKMRWSYTEPEPSLTVSDGETLWLYDPAHAEVQRMSVTSGYISGAAVQFLVGEGDIRRDFTVTPIDCSAESGELELIPRSDATYEKLRIVVDRVSGELRRTTVVDLIGNITEVEFVDVQANQHPDDGVFRFTPPEGVEVIDLDVR